MKTIENTINGEIIKNLSDLENPWNILNLAGGKFDPLFFKSLKDFQSNDIPSIKNVVHLDRMYLNGMNIEDFVKEFSKINYEYNKQYYVNYDIFEFLTTFQYTFDVITMYRYLEHVRKTDILYFIYLLSTSVNVGGIVDVIVPDYEKLAERILREDPFNNNFEADDIITTFELLNEPYDPHASIWTSKRIYKFFELEERFKVINLYDNYEFDSRDIYIRFLAKRIK